MNSKAEGPRDAADNGTTAPDRQGAATIERLKKIAELSMTLSGEPVDIFRRIAGMIGELLDVKVVCLSEIDGGDLNFLSVYRSGDIMTDAGTCVLANTPCSTVQDTRDLRVYHDVVNKFPEAVFLKKHNAYTYCGFPSLDSEGKVVAVMCLLDDHYHPFSEEDKDLLRIFAQRIGVEVERKNRLAQQKKAELRLARQQAEFDAIFNAISDCVVFVDPDFRILQINPALGRQCGYTMEELSGRNVSELFADPGGSRLLRRCLEQGGTPPQGRVQKIRFRRKNGTTFSGEALGSRVEDDDGLSGHIIIFRDITERDRQEEILRRLDRLDSLGILAGGIAHDFNNLLTAILGNISLASMHATADDPVTEYLQDAEKAAVRARDLTGQLLTFSRGGQPIKKPVSLPPLLSESASFVLSGSNVRCRFDVPDDLQRIEADPGQLSQVINNLLINAMQAMPRGGTIEIECRNVSIDAQSGLPLTPGPHVRITVRDHGIGIPEQYLERIFDPYFTTKQKGSGLGLATASSIITRHGGYMEVESERGKGTSFHIYLPAGSAKREEQPHTMEPVSAARRRILIMDDEEPVRRVAAEMLSEKGFLVETAADGAEAVDKYASFLKRGRRFDVVIMDLTIPGGMGGLEAIGKLREMDPDVRAIVSSGYSNDPIMANHAGHGFAGVIAKPYRLDDLMEVIASALKG